MNTTTRNALGASCALALACSALAGCAKPTAAATPPAQSRHLDDGSIAVDKMSPLRQRLQVAAVQEQEIATQTDAPGSIEAMPEKLVKITPPLAGRITRLQRALGDSVKAGDPLFTLDSAELSAAYADDSKAKSALLQARQELERQKTLFEAEIAARKEYEAAQAAFAQAGSDAQASADKLAQYGAGARGSRRDYVLRSPITGTVIAMEGAQGGYWNDINAPVMTVADLSTVWLSANVAERDLAQVAVGQKSSITVDAWPGKTFEGKVAYVGALLDPETRTVKVRVAIDNRAGAFKPGMFAHAGFAGASRRALLVPASAVLQSGPSTRVMVERSPLVFSPRTVEVGASHGGQVEVVSGLRAGERIVVKEGVLLND
ncbi:efflux RND transporter periplasmic adaptor subunit [Janthinobacterium lividum]|uniref:efflux RND transporter periplasmic adaptor subunit n=1 Tax=Janthinobacterium lividum TaxID=29581 RepID=UPI0008740108|nr:efflux RND transporter periplasmic adaptor subunit [Janthinobacterium lividum]MCC7713777.1 efflux RND transporter periplasmic adaptor subunit [Janthinobacterium lividum]OEZ55615.1 cobalt-zinc-cadmium resistance protein CzcB [Janthinobacterium lividum]WQE28275.1 efflux RND transporter periplasmic adaptor subunit [Janthinobacterium lividum]STQ99214.1 Cation efflux system protein CzcB [Janthinobacterium lividum]